MKILVTGCSGFIGSHLTEALLKQGHEVIGIDNYNHEYKLKERCAFVQSLLDKYDNFTRYPNIPYMFGDVDFVYHLAAIPGVSPSFNYFGKYVDNNIKFTRDLFEHFRNKKVKIVQASSSSVYGGGKSSREIDRLQPKSPYAMTKVACENLANIYSFSYGMDISSVRFFTVYGERQRPDLFIYKAIDACLNNKELIIYGDGTHSRDFTYIDDIVKGLIILLEKRDRYARTEFNIARGETISLNEVIDIIEHHIENKINIKYEKEKEGDVFTTGGHIERIQNLGYNPSYNIIQGICNQIKWQRGV